VLITVLSFLGVIIVIVIAHELGHFVTAKLSRVKVEEAGLFYPPRLFSIKRGETVYSINALPLGGFVKMSGEEDPNAPGSLASKSIPTRLLVLGAGSIMNFLLPILLLSIAFMVPHETVIGDVVVMDVAPDSPAALTGIEPGDIILSINGKTVNNSGDLQRYLYRYLGTTIPVSIRHTDLSTEEVRLTPLWKPPEGQDPIGVTIVQWVAIREIAPDSPAAGAGIRPGDVILSIDGEEVHSVDDLGDYLSQRLDTDVAVLIRRTDLTTEEVHLTPRSNPPAGEGAMGVAVYTSSGPVTRQGLSFWQAIPKGFGQCIEIFVLFKNGVVGIISGALPFDLRGPVGIAQMAGEVAKVGISPLLEFASLISINLGIINLFPLPALDGGRLAFVLLEFFRRGKRISPKKEWLIHTIGFFLLIAVFLAVTIQDIFRIVGGG
jgi:regulator of sigma E protease